MHKTLNNVLDAHKEVFEDGLGIVKGVNAAILVDPAATPQFFKARPPPYSLRGKV